MAANSVQGSATEFSGSLGAANTTFSGALGGFAKTPMERAIRHDDHQGFAVGDDAPNGVNRQLMHYAVGRRPNVDAPELIFRRNFSFRQFGCFRLNVA